MRFVAKHPVPLPVDEVVHLQVTEHGVGGVLLLETASAVSAVPLGVTRLLADYLFVSDCLTSGQA